MLFPELVVELFQSSLASFSVQRYGCPIAVPEDLLRLADIAAALIEWPARAGPPHDVSATKRKDKLPYLSGPRACHGFFRGTLIKRDLEHRQAKQ